MVDMLMHIEHIIQDLIEYCPTTGELRWLERPREMFSSTRTWRTWNTRYAGKPALQSKDSEGYYHGNCLGVGLKTHRVAWRLMTGAWPNIIDHIDGDVQNNKWANLRNVTVRTNRLNSRMPIDNRSGATGVHCCPKSGNWFVRVGRDHLGTYPTFEEALSVRKEAVRALGATERHGT